MQVNKGILGGFRVEPFHSIAPFLDLFFSINFGTLVSRVVIVWFHDSGEVNSMIWHISQSSSFGALILINYSSFCQYYTRTSILYVEKVDFR
jgi:hypothetical protein